MEPRLVSVDDILRAPSPPPDRRIPYGEDVLQFGELRLPRGGGPHPVAIVIHGGCWRAQYDLGHIGAFSHALREQGVASFCLEYRRVGNPGGGWPGTFLDVARGTDFLRSIAAEHDLDLDRVIALGHSAGGHLALWLAARRSLSKESAIRWGGDPLLLKGIVSLAGVSDLRRAVRERVCDEMAAELLGGSPGEADSRYREASPAERLPLRVPMELVHGSLDPIVPLDFARALELQARQAGDDVRLTVVEGAGHFELIAPWSAAFGTIVRSLASLLDRPGGTLR